MDGNSHSAVCIGEGSISMKSDVLLCADLDRTVIPNGSEPESPRARPLLRALAARPDFTLAYVTGRHRDLLIEAIEQYDLPVPDYAIGDVGTSIYEVEDGCWNRWDQWSEEIASDWEGRTHDDLEELFADIEPLRLQEPEKQNAFKLSYYTLADIVPQNALATMRARLEANEIRASLIWSVDQMNQVGLLDVLPERATKQHAISRAEANGCRDRLYLARGGLLGMNGNYSAGVLEGVVHFLPHTLGWLQGTELKPADP